MIEDALVLKLDQLKKQETDRKLAKTQENISQVESLRREAAPHLKYLKKQVERAERAIETQKELSVLYGEYLKREDSYLATHFDRLEQAKQEPEKELVSVQKEVAQAKKTLDNEEVVVDTEKLKTAELTYKNTVQNLRTTQSELNQLLGQIHFLESRIAAAKQKPETKEVLISHEQVEKLVNEVTLGIEKSVNQGGESILKRALSDVVHQLRSFLKKNQGEVIDYTQADEEALSELRKKVSTAESAVEKARTIEGEAENVLQELRASQVSDLEGKRKSERTMFAAIQRQRELELELRQIETELSVLERDRNEFKRELQEAVALIGRSASNYFSLQIKNENGEEITREVIAAEERDQQRTRRRNIEKLKIRLEELGVGATDDLLKEYESAKERDEFLGKELEDLATSVTNLLTLIADLQEKLQVEFTSGVDKIDAEFNTFFNIMFGGGSAKLQRVTIKARQSEESDEESETAEGVELHVALPNKRVKGLEMLSGGERALTSIALIFAMSQVNPPPFIILDETDAALDEANSRRYGDMIEALAKKSQLVLITHNRETMSRAGILYGITMGGDGVSKLLSVKFDEAAAVAK